MTESFNDVILSPDVIGTKNLLFIPNLIGFRGSPDKSGDVHQPKRDFYFSLLLQPTDVLYLFDRARQTGRWPAFLSLSIKRPSINRAWSPPCCKVGSGLKFLYRMKLRAKRGLNRGVLPIFKWLKKKKLGMGIKGVV